MTKEKQQIVLQSYKNPLSSNENIIVKLVSNHFHSYAEKQKNVAVKLSVLCTC